MIPQHLLQAQWFDALFHLPKQLKHGEKLHLCSLSLPQSVGYLHGFPQSQVMKQTCHKTISI